MSAALLRQLSTRVANMVSRAVVRLVNDSDPKSLQLLQIDALAGETRDDVERVQNYGFSSAPLAGAEAVVVFVGGRRDHGLAIAVDDRRYRIQNLESGEVAVYDDLGSSIVLKRSGDIEITPASGVAKVVGDLEADGVSLKSHTHGPGGLTAPAGTAGGPVTGNTGAPS